MLARMLRTTRLTRARELAGVFALILAACGDGVPDETPDPDPVTPDAQVNPTACDARIAELAQGLDHGSVGACSLVVRLDHETFAVKSYHRSCARYATVSEATARTTARQTTGFAMNGASLTTVDQQAYVFVDGPPDPRRVAIVSSTLGETMFGASIGDSTQGGDITYPATWRTLPPTTLECPYGRNIYSIGFDLANSGAPLAQVDRDRAIGAVTPTGLVQALQGVTDVLGAIVLRYPRATAPFDPASAEWVVVIGAGWLE